MSWDVHALLTHPLHLFNAPIFWPRTLTLAYSDLMLPAAPIYGLLHTVTGSSVAALNLTILLLMVFTQATTYALAKRLTGRDDAAILAALAFTFSGYALATLGASPAPADGDAPPRLPLAVPGARCADDRQRRRLSAS